MSRIATWPFIRLAAVRVMLSMALAVLGAIAVGQTPAPPLSSSLPTAPPTFPAMDPFRPPVGQMQRPISEWPSDDIFQNGPSPSRGSFGPTAGLGTTSLLGAAAANLNEREERFKLAETVAQVGDHYILRGELIGDANLVVFPNLIYLSKMPEAEQEARRKELLAQRDQIAEQVILPQAIDRKLMYIEFLRTVPTNPDEKKAEEMKKERQKKVRQYFDKDLNKTAQQVRKARAEEYPKLARANQQLFRIALVMKESDIESPDDPRLERILNENDTSLQWQRQAFMERAMGQIGVSNKININPEITHDQLLAHYRENINEFRVPMQARWEQLSVLFKRTPDRQVASDQINEMWNLARFSGAPISTIAKRYSQEKNAALGGIHEWTAYNDFSLSRALNSAIFSIDFPGISPIIADEEGYHVIQVLERVDEHVQSFVDAQVEIKEKLKTEMQNKAYQDYLVRLRQKTYVWTIYDPPLTANQRRDERVRSEGLQRR